LKKLKEFLQIQANLSLNIEILVKKIKEKINFKSDFFKKNSKSWIAELDKKIFFFKKLRHIIFKIWFFAKTLSGTVTQ
jgi:hypothetical protein